MVPGIFKVQLNQIKVFNILQDQTNQYTFETSKDNFENRHSF
jgi:hypothetical protein